MTNSAFSNGLRQYAGKIPQPIKPKQVIKPPQMGVPIVPSAISPVVPTEPVVSQAPISGNSLIQDTLRKRRMLGI